ncbi:TerB family tellurite resistance protein [Moritella sp. 24]|uniref:tellurite resistance TerB family protein n=1 Tax=Moritella sp. 24 TaxID=2746230 RepID=UPI001BA90303|nr:TerB family tellurite resistance protein [Moritella sp. 24]QUM76540.1 TerB family tellurite resistance protein [Moritella sp. 24]
MFNKLQDLFQQLTDGTSATSAFTTKEFELSMAALLCEVANADNIKSESESITKSNQLSLLLNVNIERANELLEIAEKDSEEAVSIYEFTSKLRKAEYKHKLDLVESMWHVAYADGVLDPYEEALIRQVSELIYITHTDFIKAKLAAYPEPL